MFLNMKNIICFDLKKSLILMTLIIKGFFCFAYDGCFNGLYFNVDKEKGTASITYKKWSYGIGPSNDYTGNVVIPSIVEYENNKYTVNIIEDNAFSNSSITSITIPNTVTRIDDNVFNNCSKLTSLIIEDGDLSISCGNQSTTDGLFVACPLTDVYLGRKVYNSKGCFKNQKSLKNITIGNRVSEISVSLFSGCTSIETIIIPPSVTTIDQYAFSGCTSLQRIVLPASIKSIGYDAFLGCNQLEQAEFADIKSLCSIEFKSPDSNPLKYTKHLHMKGAEITELEIPTDVSLIGNYTFYGCEGITSVMIKGAERIGNRAFAYCQNLEFALIPYSVKRIGEDIFIGCSELSCIVSFSDQLINAPSDYCNILVTQSALNGYKNKSNVRPIVNEEPTQTTITLTSVIQSETSDFFLLNEASLIGYKQAYIQTGNHIDQISIVHKERTIKSDNWKIKYDKLATDSLYTLEISGVAFSRSISGIIKVKTKPMMLDIKEIEATNLTLRLKGVYDGDAEVVSANFGEYGEGNEISINELYPGQNYSIKFSVLTNDGKITSVTKWFKTVPITLNLFANASSTSCILKAKYSAIDANVACVTINNKDGDELQLYGLNPNSKYTATCNITTEEGATINKDIFFYTSMLNFETQAVQNVSDTKAVITSLTNGEDDGLRFGFEWRKYDAPELVPSNTDSCPVFKGKLAGSLNNLTPNSYYKFRPFYKSDDGVVYYGNWSAFGTIDVYAYFEPVVHTYAAQNVGSTSAVLNGYALPGSDDIIEQGFEYWDTNSSRKIVTRTDAPQLVSVKANGVLMSTKVNKLLPGTKYIYRSFAATSNGVAYGEENGFTTLQDATSVSTIDTYPERVIIGKKNDGIIYDLWGRRVENPANGIYIVGGRKVSVK